METKQAFGSQPNNDQTHKSLSSYEKSREERIKNNLERMQQLGLVDLSTNLKSFVSTPKRSFRHKSTSTKLSSPLPPSGPPRRSSRLQNITPVSYSENLREKKKGLLDAEDVNLEEGSKPEVYTEEHEKLLGNTNRSWTFFVDGYTEDGKRIYDPVKGKTCHQCRQKTLGYRTNCSKCQIVQGQFCGDCLYMRYGEHVLEVLEDSNWICPVCRGICNCSLCRQAKGWAPTGPLYRKISRLGYKSVAHYLIQTRRAQPSEENLPTAGQVSARWSLPFSMNDSPLEGDSVVGLLEPQVEDKLHGMVENGKEAQLPSSEIQETDVSSRRSLIFSSHEEASRNTYNMDLNQNVYDKLGSENMVENMQFVLARQEVSNISLESPPNYVAAQIKPETRLQFDVSKPEPESAGNSLEKEKVKLQVQLQFHDKVENEMKKFAERKEELVVIVKEEDGGNNSMPKISQKVTRKRALSMEQIANSIGARVRQRSRGSKGV